MKLFGWVRNLVTPKDVKLRLASLERQRSFNITQVNNLTAKIHNQASQRTADQIFAKDGRKLRSICRGLAINCAVAKRCENFLVDRVVGEAGFVVQIRSKNDNLNRQIEDVWKEDCKAITPQGDSFRDVCAMAMREIYQAGEFYAQMAIIDGERRTMILPYEPEQLDLTGSFASSSKHISSDGIEYDQWNRAIKYFVRPSVPGTWGTGLYVSDPIEIAAANMIHVFDRQRPTQYHGFPLLSNSVREFFDTQDADTAELAAIRMSSYFGLYAKTDDPADELSNDLAGNSGVTVEDPDGNDVTEFNMEPGSFNTGSAEVSLLAANRPAGSYLPFVTSIIRRGAAAVYVPYSAATGDASSASYSSERAQAMYFMGGWRMLQTLLIQKLVRPFFKNWLTSAVMAGRVILRNGITIDDIMKVFAVQRNGWTWIDPKAEAAALETQINMGVKSWSQAAAENGQDPEELMKQISEDQKLAKKYGVTLPSPGSAKKAAPLKNMGLEETIITEDTDKDKEEEEAA